MKTLTKIVLLCIFSVSVVAQNDFSHLTPSYALKEYKVSYDSQISQVETLPAIGISLKSQYLKDFKFTLAYANEIFKNLRASQSDKDIENIYFQMQYKF